MAKAERIVQYVRHSLVEQYEREGWVRLDSLKGTYHGRFAVRMEWVGK